MPEAGVKRAPEHPLEADSVKKQATSCLDAIKKATVIVADSADFEKLRELKAEDGTTNPTLILQASQVEAYKPIVERALEAAKKSGLTGVALISEACDRLAVAFGCEILKIVPGVVSTEVDACLSFDTEASISKARRIIDLYQQNGIAKDRVLIKMATTYEGCEAAKVLEKEGIRTNMTLLFSFAQACAAAEAGAHLISPFVGRILDFYKEKNPSADYSGMNDPGVQSVTEIYNYYKKFGYKTIVMGASFRSAEEIKCLTGCDRITVSPKLLNELAADPTVASIELKLSAETATEACSRDAKVEMDEKTYRWMMNEDEMATVKLSEGIRNFNKDLQKLHDFIKPMLEA